MGILKYKVMKRLINFLVFLLLKTTVIAQYLINDTSIARVKYPGYLVYKIPQKIILGDTIKNNPIFSLPFSIKLVKIGENKGVDSIFNHIIYQQYCNNVPIEGSRIIFHYRNDSLFSITGFLDVCPDLPQNIISSQTAVNNVLNSLNVIKYKFQDTAYENERKRELNDSTATYYPKPLLTITKQNNYIFDDSTNYRYVYPVIISAVFTLNEDSSYSYQDSIYYVSATSGNIIDKKSGVVSCFSTSKDISKNTIEVAFVNNCEEITYYNHCDDMDNKEKIKNNILLSCAKDCNGTNVQLYYYGYQDIYTERFMYGVNCTYRLKDNCTGTYLYVQRYAFNTANPVDFRSDDNSFSGPGNPPDRAGATALWCLRMAHDFYRYTFGRNSYDNNYSQIKAIVGRLGSFGGGTDVETNWNFDGKYIEIGVAPGTSSYETTLDIIGHELTHGVLYSMGAFIPSFNEEGALSEGIADIFGQAIEHYVHQHYSTSCAIDDYYVGSCLPSGTYSPRSMSNPKSTGNPDTYYGINFVFPGNSSYPHTNSTVISHWYYLLSEGGQGINDLGTPYCVHGIGQDKAIRIVYEALNYISVKNFTNFAVATEIAASILYGSGPEVSEAQAAWYAVGVESPTNPLVIIPYVTIATKTDYGSANYNYNHPVRVIDYTAAPSSTVNISSAKEVHLEAYYYQNPTPPHLNYEVHFAQGSEVHVYIAPGCPNGARLSNTDSPGKNTVEESNSPTFLSNPDNIELANFITIYPNPTEGIFTLAVSKVYANTSKTIVITDVLGKTIWQSRNNTNTETIINLSDHPKGIYFVKVVVDNGIIVTKKLLVL